MARKIALGIFVILVVIQFIRPAKNQNPGPHEGDIGNAYALSSGIHEVLKAKCYDCHSNNTVYPWYTNIQPVGWWMAYHIKEAKAELNFSAFSEYPKDRADHKLEEIVEVLEEGIMPLESYLWMHKDAEVTPEEATAITGWISSLGVLKP